MAELMTKERKSILLRNKPMMQNYITGPKLDTILVEMVASEGLTQDESETIQTKPTPKAKLDQFVNFLSQGENQAFDIMLAVFKECNLGALGQVLEDADGGPRAALPPAATKSLAPSGPQAAPRGQGARGVAAASAPAPPAVPVPAAVPGIPPRTVKLKRIRNVKPDKPVEVRMATADECDGICKTAEEPDEPEVYSGLKGAHKGKMCIIAIHEFDNMHPLPGYTVDRDRLTHCFTQIGFEVYHAEATSQSELCLTAKEIEMSVAKFVEEELDEDDPCAVLAILTHGGDGLIYGRDGDHEAEMGQVDVDSLLGYLSNDKCTKMAGKPKITILQACQGASSDEGVAMRAGGPDDTPKPAKKDILLPTISDMLTIMPAMKGYVCYVYTKIGSLLIKTLVEQIEKKAATKDFVSLLTVVNQKVAAAEPIRGQKQMSHFDSSLTKMLYLFPGHDG